MKKKVCQLTDAEMREQMNEEEEKKDRKNGWMREG